MAQTLKSAVVPLAGIIDLEACPLSDQEFTSSCRQTLADDGVLTLPRFLTTQAINILISEAKLYYADAFHTNTSHNVYLTEPIPDLGDDHILNRPITSSKACIAMDQIPDQSPLKLIYSSVLFRQFAAVVLGEERLYEYADLLSSINVHYAEEGKELGWHFDNSAFAITLLLQAPESGGIFEYVKDLRDSEGGSMNFSGVTDVVEGRRRPRELDIEPGTLVLFRGRNAIHRVTPTIGQVMRIVVGFTYNEEPGIQLSEAARMTFFGRLQ